MPRPRHVESAKGVLAGAAAGALIGGPGGALVGGILGAASEQAPLPLPDALALKLQANGLQLVSVSRETKFSILVVFASGPQQYWSVRAGVEPNLTLTPDQLDDALFDQAIERIGTWRLAHGR